ncbi:hypothetical protein GIB67_039331 [Kingdonia uniflora]|uniref:EF-hand domain-containing protein n=1 Tax=Kingdonia uniflora TaxID=39325 RepID=A0A7J7LX11_9MAGN|nr:hypothetical protein GIB67_039331 [Kingdonia uniflora]
MGNCCFRPLVVQSDDQQRKKGKKKVNPFSLDYGLNNGGGGENLSVLSYREGYCQKTQRESETSKRIMNDVTRKELSHTRCNPSELKTRDFLFANKKETTALKAIDFGLLVFFKPETEIGVAYAIICSVIDFKRGPWPKVVAEHLSVEEVTHIKESFQLMDVNNNGKITLGELKVGLGKIGHNVPDADLQMLMEVADVDGNGTLDFGEYAAVVIHLRKIGNDEYLHKAFTFFDKNKSGYIEIEELRDVLADEVDTNNEEVITAIIYDVDTDKDGKISYEEFATMMKAGTDWRKASRQYSREGFNNLSVKLMKDGAFEV